jgi:hypothetical protein
VVGGDGQSPAGEVGGDPVLDLAPALPDVAGDLIAEAGTGAGHEVGLGRGAEGDARADGCGCLGGEDLLDLQEASGLPIDGVFEVDAFDGAVEDEALGDAVAGDTEDGPDRAVLFELNGGKDINDGPAGLGFDGRSALRRRRFRGRWRRRPWLLIEDIDPAGGPVDGDGIERIVDGVGADDAAGVFDVVVGVECETRGVREGFGEEVVGLVAEGRDAAGEEDEVGAGDVFGEFDGVEGNGGASPKRVTWARTTSSPVQLRGLKTTMGLLTAPGLGEAATPASPARKLLPSS